MFEYLQCMLRFVKPISAEPEKYVQPNLRDFSSQYFKRYGGYFFA
jgi:hypothetical protein